MKIELMYRDDRTIGVKLERYGPEQLAGIRSVTGRRWLQEEKV
ncbi:hypothetical protein [Saccharibacillus deserti]|nr:hypothetical protein [Saccharibacillus deserti]